MNTEAPPPRRRFNMEKTLANLTGKSDLTPIAQRVLAYTQKSAPQPIMYPTSFSAVRINQENAIVINDPALKAAVDQVLEVKKRGGTMIEAVEHVLMGQDSLDLHTLAFAAGATDAEQRHGSSYVATLRKTFEQRAESATRMLHKVMNGENLHPWAHHIFGYKHAPALPIEVWAEAKHLSKEKSTRGIAAQELLDTFEHCIEISKNAPTQEKTPER